MKREREEGREERERVRMERWRDRKRERQRERARVRGRESPLQNPCSPSPESILFYMKTIVKQRKVEVWQTVLCSVII